MKDKSPKFEPFSLTVKQAAIYFGFSAQTLYDLISRGKLNRGVHYLKIGKKVVIIREGFINWLRKQDGSQDAQ